MDGITFGASETVTLKGLSGTHTVVAIEADAPSSTPASSH
jgi:hypothetical protein